MVQDGASQCKMVQDSAIPCNSMQQHAIACNTMQYHAIPYNTMQYHAIPCNTMQYHAIPCNTMQYQAIPCNTMIYHDIPCNTMQYHASLITDDGAYHCPVGSIWPFFIFKLPSLQGHQIVESFCIIIVVCIQKYQVANHHNIAGCVTLCDLSHRAHLQECSNDHCHKQGAQINVPWPLHCYYHTLQSHIFQCKRLDAKNIALQ